jgi:hypothetical protein
VIPQSLFNASVTDPRGLPVWWRAVCMTRTLYGIYFFLGGCFKVLIGLLWSDVLQGMFIERLDEIPPDAFAHGYLTQFEIPWAFVV